MHRLQIKNYLITGGAGFIGSHLVDRLLTNEDNKVIVFDNLADGTIENISQHLENKNFKFIESDLSDLKKLNKAMKEVDIVFHLAANTDNRNEVTLSTDLQIKENITTTHHVLESMRINNVKRIVFPSSFTIYGDSSKPFSETHGPLLPTSLYGASKLTGEAFISAFHYLFGIDAWIFRFSNIVGERMSHGVIFDFVQKLKQNSKQLEILGDGNQRKPFVHVKECIDAMLYVVKREKSGLHLFNIGTTKTTTIKKIGDLVIKESGLKGVNVIYTGGNRGWINDVPVLKANVSKLKKIGWSTKLSSDEAVRLSIKELI